MKRKLQIGIIGSAGPEEYPKNGAPVIGIFKSAYTLGKLIAKRNAIIITGGKSGIMEAAAKGAKEEGGMTVGIVSGKDRNTSNIYIDTEIVSGMDGCGDAAILVLSCDGLIGIGGGAGTLQELAIAYRNKKPVVLLDKLPGWSNNLAGKYLDQRKRIKFLGASTEQSAVDKLFTILSEKDK